MVYAQLNICPGILTSKRVVWDFAIQTDHLIWARRPDLIIINRELAEEWTYNNKQRTCRGVDFAVPANHNIKLKEREKKDKYIDLARELKKLHNMKVTIITIVVSALGTVAKGLIKGLEDMEIRKREETIRLLHYWDRLKYWAESWTLEKTSYLSSSSERRSVNTDVTNSRNK